MHNIITSSILTIASLLIILLGAVDAQGLCCYSISSELKQEPNLYLLNFTASHVNSKRNNNDYIARIGFPKGYLIQGEPSSPFSYVRCIKKPELRERPVYECESKDRELFFVQFMVQLPQTSQTSQTPPQTAQTQTLPQTSQTQSSDTSQTTQLVPSDTTQSSPSDTLQPSPTDTLLSLQENIQSKNDTTTLTDTRVYIFGDKCEQRSFCIDLAASNDEQNSDKISLGPLGTWPKYAVITGGCILGLALVVALYLVYRRNVGYKYGEGGGGSYTRSGRNNSMFSPNSLLGSGGGHDGEVNYNYKPKNTLINIDDEDNNNNINRSSSMNYSNRSSGISNNDRSNRLSKHNKPHRESRIKQLESYIDEDEVVERRIDFNEKDAYDPFSSVDIELDKDTLSRLTKNDSYHHGNSNRSSKSRSNRSGNERSDEKDQSDFSDSDIQPKKRSSNDREDQRTERSRSKKQIHHSLSSKNNNDDHDSESHRGISTSIHSLRGKEYASSSDLTDKSNSDSNNREIPKSRRRKNKVNDRDRKRNSDSEETSSSDTPLGDKMPLAILATRSQSKTSLSNQSERLRKEQKSEDGREDDDEKPLGQISKATNLDDEGNDVGTKL